MLLILIESLLNEFGYKSNKLIFSASKALWVMFLKIILLQLLKKVFKNGS